MYSLSVCVLACLSVAIAAPAYFSNFGPSAGDTTLFRNDDSFSTALPFSFNFLYFDTPRNILYVDNNGILSFEGPISSYTPSGLASNGFALIAPYWADVDTRSSNGGEVYYRETSDPTDLLKVNTFVQQTKNAAFVGVKMFVVTYNNVGYYNEHEDKRCTFQVILVADSNDYSAVIFNYGVMQWATGDASGGVGGFGGSPAVIGFSEGTGSSYMQFPGSLTNNVIDVNQGTNAFIAGVPQTGQYVFYVSHDVSCINSACCDDPAQSVFVGVPADVTVTAAHIPAIPSVHYTDSCSATGLAVAVNPVETTQGSDCPYTITRTWTYVDACCRTKVATQTITVECGTTPLTPAELCAVVDQSDWAYGQGFYCSDSGFVQCWLPGGASAQMCGTGTS